MGQRGRGADAPLGAQGPAQAPDVELVDVTKRFGSVPAVQGVSLRIARGEFFALLGPSGCGKTTTLRLIGGFEVPTSGRVLLQGRDVTDVPPYRRATNMVFQQLALFPHLDVFENVAFGLRLRRLPPAEVTARVRRVLELVALPGFERRLIHQLSGGQQQRVAIARALVNEPAVLLLDEPLGSLDLKLRQAMQAELKALQHRVGTTFVYVTHDQGEALAMADRIAVMADGRVVQVGTPEEIYTRPRTRFVATFIGEANLLDGRVVGSGDGTAAVAVGPLRVRARADAPLEVQQPVTVAVRPEHVKVGPAALACENRWDGVVRERTFMGSVVRCRVGLADGVTVMAELPGDAAGGLHPGTPTPVGWAAAHGVVLRE